MSALCLAVRTGCAFLLALALGCGSKSQRSLPLKAPFLAMERDFQDFTAWHQVDLSDRPAAAQTHESGDAREYINQLPSHGSKEFPVGTILVKSMVREGGKQDIFAMVKRGAGYNPGGAAGWEWFELTRRKNDASMAIVWRGQNPPDGQGYGGVPTGGCNGCHRIAIKNDCVHGLALTPAKR